MHGNRYENASEQRAHFKLKDDLLVSFALAKKGQIDEYSGYGSLSPNADNNIKPTPLSNDETSKKVDSEKVG